MIGVRATILKGQVNILADTTTKTVRRIAVTEPTQAGIYYHTDASGLRWRIHVRWERISVAQLRKERLDLMDALAYPPESDQVLVSQARAAAARRRQQIESRLNVITRELGE